MGETLNGFSIDDIYRMVYKYHIPQALATHLLALTAEEDGVAKRSDLMKEHPNNKPTASENVL